MLIEANTLPTPAVPEESSAPPRSSAPRPMLRPPVPVSTDPVTLGGRFELLPAVPLPELGSAGGPAVAVNPIKERSKPGDLFAILCTAPVPPRLEALSAIRSLQEEATVRLVDWGVVDWSPERRQRLALIYERPEGRWSSVPAGADPEAPSEPVLIGRIIRPLTALLKELHTRGLVCGGIRPRNLFRKDASSTTMLLGDIASAPPGYAQPTIVETIERGMARPEARGAGTIADDLYSLGVTLLLMTGHNALGTRDEPAILRGKIERGTYATLTGGARVSPGLVELLRGLTADEPRQRWSLQDVAQWLAGRRMTGHRPAPPKRSTRALEVAGQEAWSAREAAALLAANAVLVPRMATSGEIDKWVRHSLGDESKAALLDVNLKAAGGGAAADSRLAARAAIALDPTAPIRYRGVAAMPDGIGPLLAHTMLENGDTQPLAEIISAQLPAAWMNAQGEVTAEQASIGPRFDSMRALLAQAAPGYGIERVAYELNPGLPCLSPLLADRCANSVQELVTSLEAIAPKQSRARSPVDRHVAAFIAARLTKLNDSLFTALDAKDDPAKSIIAVVSLLAELQRRAGAMRLPNLGAWLVGQMGPAFKQFHNRKAREKRQQDAAEVAKQGGIDKLLALVNDPEALRRDEEDFQSAQRTYHQITREIDALGDTPANRLHAAAAGRQIAAVVASIISMVVLVAIVFMMSGLGG